MQTVVPSPRLPPDHWTAELLVAEFEAAMRTLHALPLTHCKPRLAQLRLEVVRDAAELAFGAAPRLVATAGTFAPSDRPHG
jgi:hypothetical protein